MNRQANTILTIIAMVFLGLAVLSFANCGSEVLFPSEMLLPSGVNEGLDQGALPIQGPFGGSADATPSELLDREAPFHNPNAYYFEPESGADLTSMNSTTMALGAGVFTFASMLAFAAVLFGFRGSSAPTAPEVLTEPEIFAEHDVAMRADDRIANYQEPSAIARLVPVLGMLAVGVAFGLVVWIGPMELAFMVAYLIEG